MPTRPKHPCSYPGCGTLISQGYRCALHKARPFEGAVKTEVRTGQRLYNTWWWRQARAAHLEAEPLCRECGAVATSVDHEPPYTTAEEFRQAERFRSLCKVCHDRKSGRWAQQRRGRTTYT